MSQATLRLKRDVITHVEFCLLLVVVCGHGWAESQGVLAQVHPRLDDKAVSRTVPFLRHLGLP